MRMIDADELLILIDNHDNMVLEDVNSSCLKDVYKMAHVHIKDLIKMMPTVEGTPEIKVGKWMRYGEDGNPNTEDTVFWQCSECMETYTGRTTRIPNFCPNCGSEMR